MLMTRRLVLTFAVWLAGCTSSRHSSDRFTGDASAGGGESGVAPGSSGSGGAIASGGVAGATATSGGTSGAGGASVASGGALGGGGVAGATTTNGGAPNGGVSSNGGTDADAAPSGKGVLAVAVADFLDSIGVCTHIGQGVDDAAKSATAIAFAGIHEIRDDGTPARVADWITVHQRAGARLSLLTNQDVASTIDMAKTLNAAGALLAVEGPNEPNNFAVTYENATSDSTTFVPVAHLQRDLYAAVKAEPGLAGVPVFHSSEAGGSEPDNVGLQFLTIPSGAGTTMPAGTKYADFANVHNYVTGHSASLADNTTWNASDPTLNGDWDGLYVEYGHTWHGGFTGYSTAELLTLPRVTTETGWTTSGDKTSITEEQQARLFLNLYLSAYARGFRYTFIYMLRDDPNQGYWGLFDDTYAAKTSGTYLHNLTTILASGAATSLRRLDYSIPSEPVTVHDLLLEKSDGTFELAVWDDRPSGGTDDVTVTFAAAPRTADVYDPTTGTAAVATHATPSSVMLALSDHPVLIEITP